MPEESSPPLAASFQALLIESGIKMRHILSNHLGRLPPRDFDVFVAGEAELKKAQRHDELGGAWRSVFLELLYREEMEIILEGFSQYCGSCVSVIVQCGEFRYKIEDALQAVEEERVQCMEIGKRFMPALPKPCPSNRRDLVNFFSALGERNRAAPMTTTWRSSMSGRRFAERPAFEYDIYVERANEVGWNRPMLKPALERLSELKSADFWSLAASGTLQHDGAAYSVAPEQQSVSTEERPPIEPDARRRRERLKAFREKNTCHEADVWRSANVHHTDGSKWKKDQLSDKSVMSQRIEKVLSGELPLKKDSARF